MCPHREAHFRGPWDGSLPQPAEGMGWRRESGRAGSLLSQQAQGPLPLFGTEAPDRRTQVAGRGGVTWATLGQGSWQCSRRETQPLFTSPLKKCFLEIPTTFASLPKRTKAFNRNSSLS